MWKQIASNTHTHTHTFYWLLMYVTVWDMRMSRGVKITMTYGSGDQGKNDFTVLFYRALADYSLISRHMNVVAYLSLDSVRPRSIFCVLWQSKLFMSDQSVFLAPSGSVAQNDKSRNERGREVSLAGRTWSGFRVLGEVACFTKTCFSSKWRLTSFSFSFHLLLRPSAPSAHFKESEFV